MATQRLVNTNFWKDTYVIDLDPTQKLLFLYFLTNPRTTLAGVYEISIREVAFDTGIDKDMVEKILGKFMADEKMHYERGWLILRNFVKHQRLNPSIQRGIDKVISELPEWLQISVENFSSYYYQQRLELPDSPQSGTSLGTDSGERKEIKRKEKKSKEIESNQTQLPGGSGFSGKALNPKAYARAVRADEAQAERVSSRKEDKPGDIRDAADVAREKLRKRGMKV